MYDLLDHAAELGVPVNFRDLGRRLGEVRSTGLIVINDRRPVRMQRMTLAHELGHSYHCHDWRRADHDHPADERLADIYASRLLISPALYRSAEEAVGNHPGALASELGCLARHVVYWQQHHQGRGTFLRAVRDAG